MKRLFFPHTMILPDLAEALHAALGPTTLFHPLPTAVEAQTDRLAAAQKIDLVFPCAEDGGALAAASASFRDWAAEHAGRDLAGRMGRGAEIPFFGEDAASRIAAEIKAGAGAEAGPTATEGLLQARLLLMLAQEHDACRSELTADLCWLEAQERRMLKELKGDDDAFPGEVGASALNAAPPTLHMLAARIGAWSQLALAAEDFWRAAPAALFLTDSTEVLDSVTEQSAAEPLLQRYPVTAAADELQTWLADPQGPPPAAEKVPAAPALRLTLVRLTGMDTVEWLGRLAGKSWHDASGPNPTAASEGVLVGVVERA